MKKTLYFYLIILILILLPLSCAEVNKYLLQQTTANLAKCQFRLVSIENFLLLDIPLKSLTSLSQFTWTQGLRLTKAFHTKNLPVSFKLNVGVQNPNNGSGGFAKAVGTLKYFPWTLYIDEKPTIKGNISQPFSLPTDSKETLVPLEMNLNLAQFFKDRGYNDLINLALSLGGLSGSPAQLRVRAKPSIDTQFGPIEYPQEIDIYQKELNG